ncbi:hypothetical protein AGMMS4956_10140 [Bacteroidia bacterium]|nr:hypothetical protein AGMMS4956_10140 [Bacteroidia bacterium]
MIHNIPSPNISPNFTVDDIHKLREWNYARLKDTTLEERIVDTNRRAIPVYEQIELFRKKM